MKIRANVFCLVGVIIGAIAASIPWVHIESTFMHPSFEPSDVLRNVISPSYHYDPILSLSLSMFSIGVLISVLSPLGGFVQFAGLLLFFGYFVPELNGWDPHFEERLMLGFGPFPGYLSAAVSVMSLVRPVGFGYREPMGLLGRLMTFGVRADAGGRVSIEPFSEIRHVRHAFVASSLVAGVGAIVYGIVAPGMMKGGFGDHPERELLYGVLVIAGIIFTILGLAVFVSRIVRKSDEKGGRRERSGSTT